MALTAVQCLRILLVVCGVGSIIVFLRGQVIAATYYPWQRSATTAPALWAQLGEARKGNNVLMSPAEQIMIETHLMPSNNMLEWGSGYSTLWYSQFVNKYYSIEHHKEWHQDVQKLLQDRNNSKIHHVLSHVPDGHKGWPGGYEEGTEEQFRDYIQAAASFKVRKFDRVLIDGRARAACIEFILPYLKPDSVVFVHDYQSRAFYHDVVAKSYEQIGSINYGQSIVALRPKYARE